MPDNFDLLGLINDSGLDTPGTPRVDDEIFTVSEFLDRLNILLTPQKVIVRGEISKIDIRGNAVYFTLCDAGEKAVLNCLVWTFKLKSFAFDLKEGLEVKILGYPSVYKPFGKLSFQVETISPVGEGALKTAFDLLVQKLDSEGYFAPDRKRPIPLYAKTIGLITSENGDAKKDFETHLGRFGYRIYFYDVRVEGLKSIDSIVGAVDWFNRNAPKTEILVITRGGGSLESLQSFNSPEVAKAIYSSRIPVISAVGHENDITIADLVADLRASTPTHAGKIISENWNLLDQKLTDLANNFDSRFHNIIDGCYRDIDLAFANLSNSFQLYLSGLNIRLNNAQDKLNLADPRLRLKQGYSLVADSRGRLVKSSEKLKTGDNLYITFHQGHVKAAVDTIDYDQKNH